MFRDIAGEPVARRAATDAGRHRDLCRDAIQRGFATLVAETSIIGQRGGKKLGLKIPALPEYQFTFGQRVAGVGSGAPVGHGAGFRIGQSERRAGPSGTGPAGETIIELEVTLEEVDEFLFHDLELPALLQKQLRQMPVVAEGGTAGTATYGSPDRVNLRETIRERIRRRAGARHQGVEPAPGFREGDFRYDLPSQRIRYVSNAVVICLMDVSGSMDESKKFLARAFFWLLARFVHSKYEHTELVFITHTTDAREVTEEDFFRTIESGGTWISSGYQLALEVIAARYAPDDWNIYAFHCSDGDNFTEDNPRALALAAELLQRCVLFGYGEITPAGEDENDQPLFGAEGSRSKMFTVLKPLEAQYPNLGFVTLRRKDDVYRQFRSLLAREKVSAKGGLSP